MSNTAFSKPTNNPIENAAYLNTQAQGDSHIKRMRGAGGAFRTLKRLKKKTILVPVAPRVFSLERSTARDLVVLFKVLSPKNTTGDRIGITSKS